MLDILARGASTLGLTLDDEQLALFERYYHLLSTSGKHARVSSVLDYEGVQRRHYLESLALGSALEKAGMLDEKSSPMVLDLGSGGGFPGVPLRIVLPWLHLTLLEANQKKGAFLKEVIDSLALTGTTVVTARAEDAGRQEEHRGRYDLALARAVAPLPVLVELTLPFLGVGGILAATKGSRWEREVKESQRALNELRAEVEKVLPLGVPEALHDQMLVLVRKAEPTPARFPRRAGVPEKHPLGKKMIKS